MNEIYFVTTDNFKKLLSELLADYETFISSQKGGLQYFETLDKENIKEINPFGHRTFEPLKNFFFRAREIVAEDFEDSIPADRKRPLCIVGAKSCDLKGFLVEDLVFMNHDYTDPSYKLYREKSLIISTDCTDVLDTCFCTALGLDPFPKENFDLNISPAGNGYIFEVGSEKGQKLVSDMKSLFETPEDKHLKERDSRRQTVKESVNKNIKDNDIPTYTSYSGIIERNYNSDIWKDEANTCVECGACNTVCPTCHCFLLYDQQDESKLARLRVWDSCLIKEFALVAAGVNPRPFLWMRLRNRFEKKFDFFHKIANFYACTGCGRCILACPGKIDIRRVIRRLVENE